MIELIKKNRLLQFICIMICIVLLFAIIAPNTSKADIQSQENGKIIVSLGDSFSSGEGIDDFYDCDLPLKEKVNSLDWLAHRSQNSWPGMLTLPSVSDTMANKRGINWYFVAASGATTENLDTTPQRKDYYKKLSFTPGALPPGTVPALSGCSYLPTQLSVFDILQREGKDADYVTLTIGGNDVGFTDIITKAADPRESSYLNPNAFSALVDTILEPIKSDEITKKLEQAYKDIHSKTNAKIIVAGYPKLLEQTGKGVLFNQYESKLINDAVHIFNMKIHKAVLECEIAENSGGFYHFVSVEETFDGHEAYSDEPWINKVMIGTKLQDIKDGSLTDASAYSMHPNIDGAKAYAECVQQKINELERTTSDERDIVLVLDVSGSMSGEPMEETKKASSNFISTILKEDASIGIVTYDDSAEMRSDFSIDETNLKTVANDIESGGGTNIESGLAKANEMLETSNAKKKIIVLMSDGEPNDGKVGEELISYADSIKDKGTYIYTLGFFENMSGGKSDAQVLMEKIASEGCHYEVANADDLRFFFGDIADQINGQQYIYVRIACPVDVSVRYGDETLSSLENDMTTRTSFGTLTFEENPNKSEDSTDDRIKILRLKDGTDYDIQIAGNGTGKMNYTIGFMDETGEYNDLREFNDIEISKNTHVDTVAQNSDSTVLKVDSDGDGKYDLKYKAKSNGIGEIVDYTYIYVIAAIVIILIVLLIIYIKIKKWKRKYLEKKRMKLASKKKFCTYCGSEMSGDKKFCSKCGKMIE